MLALAAPGAPSAARPLPAEVGPFAHVGLAQNDGAGGAQALGHEGIARRDGALERQRSRRGGHAVVGIEIVLERDRDAVERSAESASAALRVEFIGDFERVRVDLDHRAQFGALPVHRFDALDVGLGDGAGGVFARLHHALEVIGGDLVEFERRDLALRRLRPLATRRRTGNTRSSPSGQRRRLRLCVGMLFGPWMLSRSAQHTYRATRSPVPPSRTFDGSLRISTTTRTAWWNPDGEGVGPSGGPVTPSNPPPGGRTRRAPARCQRRSRIPRTSGRGPCSPRRPRRRPPSGSGRSGPRERSARSRPSLR